MAEIIKFYPKYVLRARELLRKSPKEDVDGVIKMVVQMLLQEIEDGLDNEFEEERPFFEKVNELYMSYSQGCYFCDKEISGDETEFNLDVHLCLSCMSKVANILIAFGIDHQLLFPGMNKKIQKTRLDMEREPICQFCKQEKRNGVGCRESVLPEHRKSHRDYIPGRIPYGEEIRFIEVGKESAFPTFCPHCFVRLGQFHHSKCFVEECPVCRKQVMSCECKGESNEL